MNRIRLYGPIRARSRTMKSRAEACRKKAEECERAAARVGDLQIQANYREMSRQWHEMAERQLAIDEALTGVGIV